MYLCDGVSEKQAVGTCVPDLLLKGGNPAAPSGTATLLRLSPSQRSCFRRLHDLEHSLLPWLDMESPGIEICPLLRERLTQVVHGCRQLVS